MFNSKNDTHAKISKNESKMEKLKFQNTLYQP